jgi:hypothetical protein
VGTTTTQLDLFARTLPARPYATDDFEHGVYPMARMRALERRYVQPNGKHYCRWIPFDVDRAGAAHDWQIIGAPAPNLAVENRHNGHAHLLYGLLIPVDKTPGGSRKALWFAGAVEWGLRKRLGADPSYSGLLVQNPLSAAWKVYPWEDRLYDLAHLSEYADSEDYRGARRLPVYGLGRNCTLFDALRTWAYRAIRIEGWPRAASWIELVIHRAAALNAELFPDNPLPMAEVRGLARSVGRWVHEHYTPALFSQRQAARAAGLNARKRYYAEERSQGLLAILESLPPGLSMRAAARIADVPESSARRLVRLTAPHAISGAVSGGPGRESCKENPQGAGGATAQPHGGGSPLLEKTGAAPVHRNAHLQALPKPWELAGCSRATWYRRRSRGQA